MVVSLLNLYLVRGTNNERTVPYRAKQEDLSFINLLVEKEVQENGVLNRTIWYHDGEHRAKW